MFSKFPQTLSQAFLKRYLIFYRSVSVILLTWVVLVKHSILYNEIVKQCMILQNGFILHPPLRDSNITTYTQRNLSIQIIPHPRVRAVTGIRYVGCLKARSSEAQPLSGRCQMGRVIIERASEYYSSCLWSISEMFESFTQLMGIPCHLYRPKEGSVGPLVLVHLLSLIYVYSDQNIITIINIINFLILLIVNILK